MEHDLSQLIVGVLALQGAVSEHIEQIQALGAHAVAVKHKEDLNHIHALILPGGESTVIGKLMYKYGFIEAIRIFAQTHPVLGTCAGMILLAKKIEGGASSYLNLLDISVKRNAFGRQKESFQSDLKIRDMQESFPAIFIRAPYVEWVDRRKVDILASINSHPVFVRQGHLFACSFHPELSRDNRIMNYFLTCL